eukprot:scaffold120205_cov36-Phaeocystis_antarctica.AAC.1
MLTVSVPRKLGAGRRPAIGIPPVAVVAQHDRKGFGRHRAAGEADLVRAVVHLDLEAQQPQPATMSPQVGRAYGAKRREGEGAA